MKYISFIVVTLMLLGSASTAFAQGVPNIQNWTAQPGYANSIQTQINALKANLGPAPSAGNAGDFLMSNGTIANYYAMSGDITCSTTTPGLCTVSATTFLLANETVTGTTANKLVKFTGAPTTGIITATTDTQGAIGLCSTNCGKVGDATIQFDGGGSCVFDGATTAGDYVTLSSTIAGDCHDTGSTTAPTTSQPIGIVLSTNAAGGTYEMYFNTINTAVQSTVFTNPMTALGDMIYGGAAPAGGATRLAGNTSTTQKVFVQTGTGSASAAPSWGTISGAGAVTCGALPALTGDTTSSAGSCATTTSAVQNNSLVPVRTTTAGATLSVALGTSINQFITLHDTITLSFSTAPTDGNVVRFKLTQSNGGSHTVTWPAAVKWSGGTAPTLTTTDGQADLVQCLYDGTTTNYMCGSVLNFTP